MSLLYDQYAASLFGMIYRMMEDEQLAEDVLQQTLMKVWKSIEAYEPAKASFFTWMSVIARNTALDQKKLKSFQARQKTISMDEIVYMPTVNPPDGASLDVSKLLSGLDEHYRLVMEYAYLRGFTQEEISQTLGIPLGTVKTRLRAAIGILREQLKKEEKYFLGGPGLRFLFMSLL